MKPQTILDDGETEASTLLFVHMHEINGQEGIQESLASSPRIEPSSELIT